MAYKFFHILFGLLIAVGCSPDYSIVTGETKTIVVTETETITETITETETVEVEVPVYVEVEVPVYIGDTGEDDPGLIWVDSFIQPNTVDGIDILWVIDTSGSMYRFDPQLMAGIEVMLAALPPTSWRLAMISNDPSRAVLENQFPLVPGDDIVDAEAMYSAMGRGGREEGFDSVYEYMINNSYSSTWMRPDAGLLVVFVSDEEEQSGYPMASVTDFTNWYSAQRGGNVFLASIVTQDPTVSLCDCTVSTLDVGDRYMEATNHFGGVVIDICDTDWAPGVTDATHSISPYELWPLTHEPVVDSIVVFIDGALSDGTDWIYSATDNTVYFTTIPGSGSLVEIGYRYLPTADTGGADTATP